MMEEEKEMLKRNQDNPAQSDKAKSMMKNRIKFLTEVDMTKQQVIDEIKELVVNQVSLDPKERNWLKALEELVNRCEGVVENG